MLKVHVTGAQCSERSGARQLLEPLAAQFPQLNIVWADQGYSGDLGTWIKEKLGWHLEVVRRPEPK